MTPSTPPPPSPAVTCAENIALLYLLHSVPDPPSRNSIDRLPIHQNGYTLSLLQERRLAGMLAFLSNLKDGPEHIPAVCVQEGPQSAFLNVLLAVNKARPGDGEGVLQNLKLGFERIFTLLSRVSDGDGTLIIEDQVFTEIISMCSVRILCRLRFIRNSRNTPRQPIKELLQDAVDAIRRREKETVQDTELLLRSRLFVEGAKEVIKLVDAWAKHRKPVRLGELVEGVNRLWQVGELQDLLSAIPNQVMGPTSRKNLLNIISKVARYREAARFLYRTAKKIPLVRQMTIVLVSLPQNVFQKRPANQSSLTLPSTVSRINALHKQQWNVGQVCRLLKVSEVEANDQFVQQTRKTLKDAKIHAEIQLLFYCELEAFKLPPRAFCSTKDACFLCNAFIRMHGKIHTPGSHGRLYPGWRLPFSPRLKEMEQRFNTELAHHIRNSLTTLLSRQQKTVYPDPHESTLLTLSVSMSTLSSSALPEAEEGVVLQPQIPNRSETDKILSNPKAPSKPSERTPSSPTARTDDVLIQPSNDITPKTLPSPRELSSDSISVESCTLLRGQILSKGVEVNHASPLYDAGHLEVQIEYSIGPSQITPNSHPSDLSYSLEWLAVGEAEKVLEQHASSIVNAESLEGEISHGLDDLNCFYITARGSVLKIFLQPSNAGVGSAL
ncbi:hypothetical protein LHYA1_G003353 [Lachnellula hyalina]|uniref:Uncharacterized protein n=1 Tax=Lachnellula hyalina TaxID=1316788 RepID=A0A8H8R436_9HELO|nr:uncharacterized protein LHYA1_G003353 [Lachnellula hyalina]TVY28202.1 hypothetical protein LHYA1_G003353 [Lachnellula hyalina]